MGNGHADGDGDRMAMAMGMGLTNTTHKLQRGPSAPLTGLAACPE